MSEQDSNRRPTETSGVRHRSGRSSRLPYVVATLLLGVMVGVAWIGRDRFRPVVPGTRAPDFEATDLEGRPVALDDYRDKVVLLNIWATWCAPCRSEMPSMERLYRELGGTDFEILAVSVDGEGAATDRTDGTGHPARWGTRLAQFAHTYDLTFPILHDPSGRIQRTYQTTGVPESFLIDRDGVIVKRVAGATLWDHDRYRELVRRLLDG